MSGPGPSTRTRILDNLGDASPLEHGGWFVLRVWDRGRMTEEAEVLVAPDDDAPPRWEVYRFALDRLKEVRDEDETAVYLVPAAYDASWPHGPSLYQDWFVSDLPAVARTMDYPLAELRADLCAADPVQRARAYQAIGDYHGYANFDSDPLTLRIPSEVARRYRAYLRRPRR